MPYELLEKRRQKTLQWKKDNPEKVKAQKQRWRERKRACAPEQEMWVRKSSLHLRSRTVYPGIKELTVLLTDYKKSSLSFIAEKALRTRASVSRTPRKNRIQRRQTEKWSRNPQWLAGHREKHRIRQREYRRRQAEKWSRNPQGLAEYREKTGIRQHEYRRRQAEKWSLNPQGLAEHREKHRIRQREYQRKRVEKRKRESHCVPCKEGISGPQKEQQDRQCMEKRVNKTIIDEKKKQCDECGLCLVCGGYAAVSWGHKLNRVLEEQERQETMSEATSSVGSSMANELNDLLTLLSKEDKQSDFSEDSNLLVDMEQELNLSSKESSTGTEEEEIKKVLNRKRHLQMQGLSCKVKGWMHETTMSDMMSELGDELDIINSGFRNMIRAHAQFRREDEVENTKDEYIKTLEVTGRLMNELQQWLCSTLVSYKDN